ncbi:hypothetical protein BJ973_004404 [Actinoplanes tereljensis]|uniref:Uncharacterized protein n=1 Tax=Paractinoplanes tereljensis TaxID=571912 RepID=A0A919TVX5_9ACTN|nr:hypothetical protein [Actinoplanes tereljensis]GIF23794.1 hypothetical protein Ate02nite_65240 [Actinoplanes tereljensis]
MSYDLAVWEGERPADIDAGEAFEQLYRQFIESSETTPPTPAMREYVAALLARWVDLTEDEDDSSPWSAGPLINEASGPIIYFAMRYSMADEVSAIAARMAADRGLVCFDPQQNRLRPRN